MIDQKFIQTKLTHQLRKAECSGNPAITNDKCINSTLADYKVYGNSEQDDCGENLLNIAMTPTTISGITCTKLDSGFYQFIGTSTARATFSSANILSNRKLFKAGTYYIPYPISANVNLGLNFSTASSGGSLKQVQISTGNRKFTLDNDYYLAQWYLYCYATDTAYDFSFFPQITKEDITEHKAYVSAPTPDTPSEIRSVGDKSKNFLGALKNTNSSIVSANGATSIVNEENQTVTVTNTNSRWGSARLLCNFEAGKTYTLTVTIDESNEANSVHLYAPQNLFADNKPKWSSNGKTGDTIKLTFKPDFTRTAGMDSGFVGLYPDTKNTDIAKTASATFSNISLIEGTPEKPYIIPIRVKSKNLFNINETQLTNPKGSYFQPIVTIDGTTLKLQARNANAIQCAYFHCDVGKGRKVTLRVSGLMGANASTANSRVRYSFTDDVTNIGGGEIIGNHLSGAAFSQSETKTYSVTVTSTARYMLICMSVQLTDSDLSKAIAYYSNIQVEYGDSVTDYEEYKEPETKSIYLNEPLRAIGEYKDYIDFKSGKVIRNIRQSYPATITGVEGNYNFYILLNKLARPKTYICLCSHFQHKQASVQQNIYNCFIGKTGKYFNFQNPDIEHTVSAGNTFLKEKQPILNYVLAAPTEETIDLPKLPQFKGATVYTIDTNTNGEFWCKYKYKN